MAKEEFFYERQGDDLKDRESFLIVTILHISVSVSLLKDQT